LGAADELEDAPADGIGGEVEEGLSAWVGEGEASAGVDGEDAFFHGAQDSAEELAIGFEAGESGFEGADGVVDAGDKLDEGRGWREEDAAGGVDVAGEGGEAAPDLVGEASVAAPAAGFEEGPCGQDDQQGDRSGHGRRAPGSGRY
jgi:hypothetical protein